jgi:hypothetical protein
MYDKDDQKGKLISFVLDLARQDLLTPVRYSQSILVMIEQMKMLSK